MSNIESRRLPPADLPLWKRVGMGALAGIGMFALVVASEWLAGSIDRGTTRDAQGRPLPVEPFLRSLATVLPVTGALVGLLLPLYRTKLGAAVAGALSIAPVALQFLPKLWHAQMVEVWQMSALLVALAAAGAVTAIGARPAVIGTGKAELPEFPADVYL